MMKDIEKILITSEEIGARVRELGQQITNDYVGKDILMIGVLRGAVVFMADLLRRIPLGLQVESLRVASYRGTRSSGRIDFRGDWVAGLGGRHVLLLDDILDSGLTLHSVKERMAAEAGAASVRTCELLRKNVSRVRRIEADYVGFDIPDEFVVGYGLVYN